MNLNENLKLFRKRKGLTQKELAEKIGVTSTTITRYEKNVRTPDINTLQKIADALEISLNLLLSTNTSQKNELVKDILEYIDIDRNDMDYCDLYAPKNFPSLGEIFYYYFGFDMPSNIEDIDENDLTFMLFVIIQNDLSKFIKLFSLYHEIILSFKKQNLKVIDDILKGFNLSIEQLIEQSSVKDDNINEIEMPKIFKSENKNKYIDYSATDLREISYAEALSSFQKILDYIKFNSNNSDLKTIGHDLDEEKPLFEKTIKDLELGLIGILFNRGELISKSELIKGDDSNGNQEE